MLHHSAGTAKGSFVLSFLLHLLARRLLLARSFSSKHHTSFVCTWRLYSCRFSTASALPMACPASRSFSRKHVAPCNGGFMRWSDIDFMRSRLGQCCLGRQQLLQWQLWRRERWKLWASAVCVTQALGDGVFRRCCSDGSFGRWRLWMLAALRVSSLGEGGFGR